MNLPTAAGRERLMVLLRSVPSTEISLCCYCDVMLRLSRMLILQARKIASDLEFEAAQPSLSLPALAVGRAALVCLGSLFVRELRLGGQLEP